MECCILTAPGRGRTGERADPVEKFEYGPRPPMGQDDRERTFVLRARVDEVDPDAVQGRAKLRERVQRPFRAPPIIVPSPVVRERADLCQRDPLRPVRYRFLVRPASSGKFLFEIIQCCLRYIDLERSDVLRRRGKHDLLSLHDGPLRSQRTNARWEHTSNTGCRGRTYELTPRDDGLAYSRSPF